MKGWLIEVQMTDEMNTFCQWWEDTHKEELINGLKWHLDQKTNSPEGLGLWVTGKYSVGHEKEWLWNAIIIIITEPSIEL